MRWLNTLVYLAALVPLALVLLLRWNADTPQKLLLKAALSLLGYLAALGDLKSRRVANELVLLMLSVWVIILVPQLFIQTQLALKLLLDGLIGALLSGVLFLLVYLVSRRGLGGGDVKLMTVSGLYLGASASLAAMLCGSVLAALTGIVLLIVRKIGRKDTIPLVPFLYAGMLLSMLVQ